ncbi:MAG TPA: DUF167 domain-containing protein [Parvularculaceae bacterium]|nr:DUF167 domain-containing protein [Parvularculaceae bacterium]
MASAFKRGDGEIRLRIRVTPNASRESIGGLWRGADGDERLAIRVTAPPDKGRANVAVAKFIAKALGLSRSAVAVVAGEKDRLKTLAVKGDPDAIAAQIENLMRSKTE